MPSPHPSYTHFVASRLARAHAGDPGAPIAARVERVEGAVAFADIIGYTALTEAYAQRGPEGIEALSLLLNEFFGRLEKIVVECGGDIMSFAGDSVLALWTDGPGGLVDATRSAAEFAQRAQCALDGKDMGAGASLRMRIAIVAGDFQLATAGGVNGHWHHVVTGAPLAQIGALLESPQGSIVVSAGAWPMISSFCSGEPHPGATRVLSSTRQLAPARSRGGDPVPSTEMLRGYIPAPVLEHLDAGQLGRMSEYRRATTLFAGVAGVDCLAPDGLAGFQSAITAVQEAVEKYHGTLTRIIVDDKGANALAVWGIPGRQHEDDPLRAVRAGLDIERALRRQRRVASVGIAAGRVLCGLTGGGSRYEYSVAGNTVNLAARLMAHARGAVVCDAPTVHGVQDHFAFEALGRFKVKGRELPCDAYRAIDRPSAFESALQDGRSRSLLVGRARHRNRLVGKLEALSAGDGGVAVLAGEPGIGKTRLLHELAQAAHALDVACLVGRADAIEARTTYFSWRAMLQQLLRLETSEDPAARRRYLEDRFASQPRLQSWLPLLNDILPLGFPESPLTAQMSEQARAEGTSEIVVRLLQAAAARRPVLLVFDDVQWMDSMSWLLAAQVKRRVQPALLALALRTGQGPAVEDIEAMALLESGERIELEPLSRDDTAALLGVRLGVHSVAEEVVSLVYGQSAGNPLFSEEVAMVMRESGHLRIEDEHCTLGDDAAKRESYNIGTTVQGVIASRIDLLSPAHKTTLKVASVLGGGFSPALLRAVLPAEGGNVDIGEHLAAFARLELVVPDANVTAAQYSFKHGITREVAYAMLTVGDRRKLHQAVACWYEREYASDLTPYFALLAHHWDSAGDPEATLRYLHKAGEQAVNRFANREAAEFLERAILLLDGNARPSAPALRATCERLLGNALLWMGQLPESRLHLQNSVALLGFRIPGSRKGQALGSVAQLAAHMFRRLPGVSAARRALTQDERDTAMAMLRLGHIGYFQEDPLLMFFTCVRCIDFAERAEECRESALMFAALAGGAGSVPLHGIAATYGERALRIAEAVGDPSVTSQALLFSAMYRTGIGDWVTAMERVRRAEELSGISGDNRRREECMVLDGYLHFHSGGCSMALVRFESAARAARLRGDRQTCAWGLLGMSRARLHQGRCNEALETLRQAAPLAADRISMIELQGQLALVHFHRGEFEPSLAVSRQGLALALQSRPTSFSTLTGLGGIVESLLELWSLARLGRIPHDTRLLERDAKAALDALGRYARIFPIGTPEFLLRRGHHQRILGRKRRALSLWRKALAAAERLRMPYEEAKAALAIAHVSADDEAEARALAIFDRIAMEAAEPARPVEAVALRVPSLPF
jgi:class 3 adenylate cyclase/tetratricopeptide (TPR) repeat protein